MGLLPHKMFERCSACVDGPMAPGAACEDTTTDETSREGEAESTDADETTQGAMQRQSRTPSE
jgi:hypothetical protein